MSNFDSDLTSARTVEELEEFKKTRLQETIAQKRQFRQQKLEQSPENDPAKDEPVPVDQVLLNDKH